MLLQWKNHVASQNFERCNCVLFSNLTKFLIEQTTLKLSMRLSFKYESSRFELSILNRRLTIRNFFFANKLSTSVLEMIQIVTIITRENEISRRHAFKFSISFRVFFFRDKFIQFVVESSIVCETRKRNKRDERNDKNVFREPVVLYTTLFWIEIDRFMIVVVFSF